LSTEGFNPLYSSTEGFNPLYSSTESFNPLSSSTEDFSPLIILDSLDFSEFYEENTKILNNFCSFDFV
jgi:hypothetical protein